MVAFPIRTKKPDSAHRQLAEIEQGLAEADRGDFASEEEMRALFQKWGIR